MVPLECAGCHKSCRDDRGAPYFAETVSISVYDEAGRSGGVLYHFACIPTEEIHSIVARLSAILASNTQ